MTATLPALRSFLDTAPDCALVEVLEAKGSTPRDTDAWMLVSADGILGTIGGGRLEYMAIDQARRMLADVAIDSEIFAAPHPYPLSVKNGERESQTSGTPSPRPSRGEGKGEGRRKHQTSFSLSIPLGPEIGQCCGGRVEIGIRHLDDELRHELLARARSEDDRLPHVYLFGGGHVGRAIASVFALLPVRTIVVETRAEAVEDMPLAVESRLTPVPEDSVRRAPPGSAFVILTHDHALDFLIVAEALKRNDAAYVGMIGSRTKRMTFRRWYLNEGSGSDETCARLVCPIGGDAVPDKRPSVIAVLAAAEIVAVLAPAFTLKTTTAA